MVTIEDVEYAQPSTDEKPSVKKRFGAWRVQLPDEWVPVIFTDWREAIGHALDWGKGGL